MGESRAGENIFAQILSPTKMECLVQAHQSSIGVVECGDEVDKGLQSGGFLDSHPARVESLEKSNVESFKNISTLSVASLTSSQASKLR